MSQEELFEISQKLDTQANRGLDSTMHAPIKALASAVDQIRKTSSGSWLGYQANVYYQNFLPPPSGAHFSKEWGLQELYSGQGTKGNWVEYDPDVVKAKIFEIAGNPNLEPLRALATESEPIFEEARADILSIISTELSAGADAILDSLKSEIQNLEFLDKGEILSRMSPQTQVMTRDSIVQGQGSWAPPHKKVEAEIAWLHNATAALVELSKLARRIASHIKRKQKNIHSLTNQKLVGFEEYLHPLILEHAYPQYLNGHLREAVFNSITALYDYIRVRTGSHEDGENLINHVFAPDRATLILSELQTESGKNDQKGFMQIFKGAYQGIRNPKAHSLEHDLDQKKTVQYLIFASLMIRRVEEASLAKTKDATGTQ